MRFDWDDTNRAHIARHAVGPEEAEQAFLNDPVDLEVQEDDADVLRYKQIGETDAGRILVLLSTDRGDAVRILTAFDAAKAFKDLYLRMKARESWKRRP